MVSSVSAVRPEDVGVSSERLLRVDSAMQRYVDQQKLAGIVTMLARRGEVFHFERFGVMDLDSQLPMQLDTIFRIYSMTKPITSVAAMMLWEEGGFLLHDPVEKYIPELGSLQVYAGADDKGPVFEPMRRSITIRDLFTHTAGLGYGILDDSPVEVMVRNANVRPPEGDLDDMVERLSQLPLAAQPGTVWRYSLATDVLGKLVEVVSGMSFDDFMSERIFKPLGMYDTGFWVTHEKVERLATVYGLGVGTGIQPIDSPHNSPFVRPATFFSGGGGLISTASDYMQFAQMLLNNGELNGTRLLGRKTVELMTTNHLPENLIPFKIIDALAGYSTGYGFGLLGAVMMDPTRAERFGSVGEYNWSGAASTTFWVDPREELVGVFMTQFMPTSQYPVESELRTLTYQALVD